jgi:hypothetical protein
MVFQARLAGALVLVAVMTGGKALKAIRDDG